MMAFSFNLWQGTNLTFLCHLTFVPQVTKLPKCQLPNWITYLNGICSVVSVIVMEMLKMMTSQEMILSYVVPHFTKHVAAQEKVQLCLHVQA